MHLEGKYNTARVYVDVLEPTAEEQILELLNQKFTANSRIRIMPDVHAGKGCVIGTTMEITDKVVPNLVGVDIGCGLNVLELMPAEINLEQLDRVIRANIPAGFAVRTRPHPNVKKINLQALKCAKSVDVERGLLSIGTLGGGNHFIELNEDENKRKYLVIHSGSRNIGLQTAEYYQQQAIEYAQKNKIDVPRDLSYLEGKLMEDYLHDMAIMQRYAALNRDTMAEIIIEAMGLEVRDSFQTVHNYIDLDHMILRKGAVSAQDGELFIIPFNMADGSVILRGKGNPEWNYSAPHGAGRVLSRTQARRRLTLADYRERVSNIYSTSISRHTLDEAPQAYKDPDDILRYIHHTAEVERRLKVLYNYKAK